MPGRSLRVAMIHDVFHDAEGPSRLDQLLAAAREARAELAVLPELALDRWVPATREVRDEDAEEPAGPRHRRLAAAARKARIALLGGAIVRQPDCGRRFNRALLFDADGAELAAYDKLHIPGEPGFWESDHYSAGNEPPRRVDGLALPLGLQICSDLQRPAGCQVLAAQGAAAILGPRATPPESYERWRTVMRATAITCAVYVVSVNRPRPEGNAPIGGPSVAFAPDGAVISESTEPLTVVELDGDAVSRARGDYPGYLAVRDELYARAWAAIGRRR